MGRRTPRYCRSMARVGSSRFIFRPTEFHKDNNNVRHLCFVPIFKIMEKELRQMSHVLLTDVKTEALFF